MDRETERPGIRGITVLLDFRIVNKTMQMHTHREIRRPMKLQKIGWYVVRLGLRIMTGKMEWEFKKV